MSETTERRSVLTVVLPVMLLACAAVGVAVFYLAWRPAETVVGRLTDYPPSTEPYRVQVGNRFIFLVNSGDEVLLLEPRFTSSNHAWNCEVKWVPTNGRYEDPCSGAKFSLVGEWLNNVYGPNNIEPRGLSHYPAVVRGDQIWLVEESPIPGALAVTATP